MAKNKIDDLRDHLFETIEALKDQEKPMDLERAKTIASVAQTIINSAKVEVELAHAVNSLPGSAFFNIDLSNEDRLLEPTPRSTSRLSPDEAFGQRRVTAARSGRS